MWSRSRSASAWRSHERGRAPEAHRRRAGCLARGPRDPRRHAAQRLHGRALSRDRRRQGRADRVRRRARGYGRAAHDGARRDGQGPRSRLHRPPRPPRPCHDPLGARALRPAPRDDERLRRHAPAPGAGRRARVPPRRRRAHGGAAQVLLDDPASRAVPHGGRGAPLPLPRPREGTRASPRGGDRRGDALAGRMVRQPGPRAQGGAGARLAPHAHLRRLDAGVPARPRLRGSPDPRRPRARCGAGRRLPHGHAEPGALLRPRWRPRRDRARPLRRRLPARRPCRASARRRRRTRAARRLRRPAARARGRAPVVAHLHVARGPAHRRLASPRRRLRAPGEGPLPGDPPRERGDHPARGTSARSGRSPRGPPRPRRALGGARDRRGLCRPTRRPGRDDQHRLQHRGARPEPRGDGARGEPPPRAPRRRRGRRRDAGRPRAAAAARGDHDARLRRRRRRAGRGAPRGARRARLLAPRAPLHAVLPLRGFPARRPADAARCVGRQAESAPPAVAAFVAGAETTEGGLREVRRQRRLALGVLLGACALAALAFPLRSSWWGGWILAIAEAGIVGGLADWFAVTAIFRRPLGLPIPHTALIPANWELMAARVGTMVGSRVLTKEYVAQEVARVDVASMIARAVERLTTRDLDTATRELARWLAAELSPKAAGDLVTRLRDLLLDRPLAPALAAALELARRHGWDQRGATALAGAVAEALDRPAFRSTVGELGSDLRARYRERMGTSPRFWLGVASLLGLIDRDPVLAAIQTGLRQVVRDPDHPLRQRPAEAVGDLPARLRADPRLAARVEAAKRDLLATPVATRVLEDAAAALQRELLADLDPPRLQIRVWIVERLARAPPGPAGG